MFLEQIEREQRRMMEERKTPKTAWVSSGEISPSKGLAASSYVPGSPDRRPAKTLALKLEAEIHDRILALMAKTGTKTKKAQAYQALMTGLTVLEEKETND